MAYRARFSIIPLSPVPGVDTQIDFDCTSSRTRDRQGTAIRWPKESGAESLVDDVEVGEVMIAVTGHFTDTPSYYAPGLGGYEGRGEALAAALRAVQQAKARCTVIYGDEILTSMVIERLSEPRDSETGDGVDVDLTMVQIEVGELKLVEAVADAQVQALGQVAEIGWLP